MILGVSSDIIRTEINHAEILIIKVDSYHYPDQDSVPTALHRGHLGTGVTLRVEIKFLLTMKSNKAQIRNFSQLIKWNLLFGRTVPQNNSRITV